MSYVMVSGKCNGRRTTKKGGRLCGTYKTVSRNSVIRCIYLWCIYYPYLLIIVEECGQGIAQETTVMVLTFYHKSIFMDVRMHRICMVCKKMDELFGRAAKQQQYGEPYTKHDMSYLLYQTDANIRQLLRSQSPIEGDTSLPFLYLFSFF